MTIDWMIKLNLPFLSPFMWPQKHVGCVQSLKERERKKKKTDTKESSTFKSDPLAQESKACMEARAQEIFSQVVVGDRQLGN